MGMSLGTMGLLWTYLFKELKNYRATSKKILKRTTNLNRSCLIKFFYGAEKSGYAGLVRVVRHSDVVRRVTPHLKPVFCTRNRTLL